MPSELDAVLAALARLEAGQAQMTSKLAGMDAGQTLL